MSSADSTIDISAYSRRLEIPSAFVSKFQISHVNNRLNILRLHFWKCFYQSKCIWRVNVARWPCIATSQHTENVRMPFLLKSPYHHNRRIYTVLISACTWNLISMRKPFGKINVDGAIGICDKHIKLCNNLLINQCGRSLGRKADIRGEASFLSPILSYELMRGGWLSFWELFGIITK